MPARPGQAALVAELGEDGDGLLAAGVGLADATGGERHPGQALQRPALAAPVVERAERLERLVITEPAGGVVVAGEDVAWPSEQERLGHLADLAGVAEGARRRRRAGRRRRRGRPASARGRPGRRAPRPRAADRRRPRRWQRPRARSASAVVEVALGDGRAGCGRGSNRNRCGGVEAGGVGTGRGPGGEPDRTTMCSSAPAAASTARPSASTARAARSSGTPSTRPSSAGEGGRGGVVVRHAVDGRAAVHRGVRLDPVRHAVVALDARRLGERARRRPRARGRSGTS